ncbi:MAG: triose-phosphate isomerase [Christensenellales bacterium]
MPYKLYIGTNTKMYKTAADTVAYLKELSRLTSDISRNEMELFVIPSYTSLHHANAAIQNAEIKLGAQNMAWEDEGQFTGEISPLMLSEIGIDIVMIGHSERRHVFGESDHEENLKVRCALRHGFTALLCIGETQQQKDDGVSDEALRMQIKRGLKDVDADKLNRMWIAYEPVWAIGVSGKPASAEYADEKHGVIKDCLLELYGAAASDVPVLYGGSVNNQNATELIGMANIDGLFIGRSAWQADNFNYIIRQALPLFRAKRSSAK